MKIKNNKQKIIYTIGDATYPVGEGNKIIVHICNNVGLWGKGFVLAIYKRWNLPRKEYLKWYKLKNNFELGEVQFVQVEEDIWIENLIGQNNVKDDIFDDSPPIRYEAVENGLAKVAEKSKELNASVHMPRIGCGLAGGKWNTIKEFIHRHLIMNGITTTVYDINS